MRACVCESSIGRWGAPNAASHDMPLRGLSHISPPLPCACPLLPVWSRRLSQLVKHIVKAGAKVNVADKNGWRALHYAGYGGSYDVCLVMLSVAALDYRYG